MKKIKLFLAAMTAMFTMGVNAQEWTGNAVANGTFYLYNVGAQKYLNNGDPLQNWGTNAYLQAGFGLDVVIAEVGEGVYTIETNIHNGGNQHYLGNTTWCDADPVNWQFKAVEGETNTYQIIYDSQYLMANEALNDVEMIGDPGSRTTSTYWKLVSEDDFKAAMIAKEYSATDPMDVSVFIKGRSFARNDGRNSKWTTTHNGGNWTWIGASDNKYYGNEAWNNTFDVHQEITGLPDGTYEVQCSGFGTNGTTYVYGNTTTGLLQTDNSTSWGNSKEAKWKAIHEDNAFAGQSSGTFTLSGGKLTVGIKRETNKSGDWAVWDEFRLYYYGLDLSEFAATLAAAVAEAEALAGNIPTAAYNVLDAVVMEQNKTYTTAAEYAAAAEAITNATNTVKTLVAPYAAYKVVAANAAIAGVEGTTIDEQTTAVNDATTVEGIEACTAALQAAIDALAFDITSFTIKNPTAQTKDNWEGTDFGGQSDGVCEYWNVSPAGFHQTISLPAGTYRLTVVALQRTGMTGIVYAGENSTIIAQVSNSEVNNRGQAANWFNAGNGKNYVYFTLADAADVVIGLKADETLGDHWTVWQSFKLDTFQESVAASYLAAGYAPLVQDAQAVLADEAYANVTGNERTALETAIAATPSTIAEYEAAVDALNNAVAAFKAAKANYDIYATERALADAISTDITVPAPDTAEDALVQFRALKVAEFNYVANAYPYSATSKIGDFSTWERTGTVNGSEKNEFEALTSQHWSGNAMTYYEQPAGGWGANAWTANYTKTTTLPAGTYVIKVAARAASGSNTVAKITCSASSIEGPIFNFGDTGKGITITGEASFDEGDFCNGGAGRGWVWNYLPFTLTAETEVTMTVVAEANGTHQWFSVCDGELLSKTNIATAVAYNDASANAITDVEVANVTISRNIKEGFNTVVLPFDLTASQVQAVFGSGTEVYAFSEDSYNPDDVTISFNKVVAGTITANVPVLVKATAASSAQVFEGVQVVAPTDEAKAEGRNFDFVGTYAPMTVAAGDYFIGNDALYKSTGTTNINAFRAYLKDKTTASGVKLFIDGEEIATGILTIDNGQLTIDNAIYNLAGQRLQKMQKGINIVNGKKVLF
ncbi:MAG: hypothetical protein IJS63_06700 [Bacteroidaceae bacterium]|nr:hypothetical protein [Bacteroidaceae bacterium]